MKVIKNEDNIKKDICKAPFVLVIIHRTKQTNSHNATNVINIKGF
jgi:hypothetical protein